MAPCSAQVAFLDSGRSDIIWYFDRVVDFFFLLDIFINFNLCYYDDARKRYVQSRSHVAARCAPARGPGAAYGAHGAVALPQLFVHLFFV